MARILVTGGAGFIGSNLCTRLVQDPNNYVTCLDNLYSGSLQNIQHLNVYKNFQFINHDVIDPINRKVDIIYHLACPASPVFYQKDPIQTTKTSVLGSINMLELAKEHNAKILFSSTSEVYGDPIVHPQHEDYWGNVNPVGIRSCYDEGKRCAETLFFDYHRQYNVDIKVIRIFNTYGERMLPNDGRVVSNFIMQALTNKDITIYGSGSQTRSFQYISDLLDAMQLMMDSNTTGTINLGNPNEFTILELANLVIEKINSKSKIVFKPLPQDDPKQRKPDITKAKELLHWEPKINLETGLNFTIEYFISKLG